MWASSGRHKTRSRATKATPANLLRAQLNIITRITYAQFRSPAPEPCAPGGALPSRALTPKWDWHGTSCLKTTVFVVFKYFLIQTMIRMWTGSIKPTRRFAMHDLLIALAFIGMVVAPAVVAAKSGAEAADELDD